MQQELLQKTQDVTEIGRHIGLEAGEEMAKRFFDKHPEQAFVNILGKKLFMQVLSQPGCEGIAIVPGYNAAGVRQAVIVAVDANRQPIFEYAAVSSTGEIVMMEGLVGDDGSIDHSGWGSGKESGSK
jgi:hypothetical protein